MGSGGRSERKKERPEWKSTKERPEKSFSVRRKAHAALLLLEIYLCPTYLIAARFSEVDRIGNHVEFSGFKEEPRVREYLTIMIK